MEKENKPKAKGKAKKAVTNKEQSAQRVRPKQQAPKQQAKTRLVQCVVVNRFYDSKQNKEYGINQLWEGTLERIEEINNKIHQGRRLNALKIVKSENE